MVSAAAATVAAVAVAFSYSCGHNKSQPKPPNGSGRPGWESNGVDWGRPLGIATTEVT